MHRSGAEVDANYALEVGVQGSIAGSLEAIADAARIHVTASQSPVSRNLIREELEKGSVDQSFPLLPQRVVADTRAALRGETSS